MNADRAQLIKDLFAEATERIGEERAQFLNHRCGNDSDLRAAIERLLLADGNGAAGFLTDNSGSSRATAVPTHVGRFRLLRKIGEGGMGTVFEAEQNHPRRRVALKMVRLGNQSAAMLRRFEYEVQILGQLRHPGIAQIHEAGTHYEAGLDMGAIPYFAMEYVHGPPLLEFARDHLLTVRERLNLMADICDAVHHAHQKGVIHRDLKPANVLVEESGSGKIQPKILDFGVARATRSDVELVTLHTEVGQLVGTLSYMSPEQVAGHADDLDVRSDVYALGVMLYELLADRLPYDLRGRSIADAGTIIREQKPTRLSSIDTSFRGDIETIVAKALAKEKEHRYQSAGQLGEDIRRYLRDEPIIARLPNTAYHIRKFAKRHKGLVGGVVAAFVFLLVAVVGIGIALVRATQAEHAALRSASKATAVSRFLQNMLDGFDPDDIGIGSLTVREVLDHAATRLDTELTGQPEVAAALHQTLGNHYSTLGLFADADRHLRKSLDLRRSFTASDDPELADAIAYYAANLQEKRALPEAEAPTREALEMRRRLFGDESLEVAASLYDLAALLMEQWRPQEAEPLARKSLEIRRRLLDPDHAHVAISTGLLGYCFMALQRFDEAEDATRQAVEMIRRLPGDNELALASRLTFLANVLRARGNHVEEEAALREAIDLRSRRLTPDHPALAWNRYCLANVRWKLGDFDEAEANCRWALEIFVKQRGPTHDDIANCLQLMAQIYDDRGRFVEAEGWWLACLEMRRKLLPPDHPDITFAENALLKDRAAQSDELRTPDRGP